MATSKDRTVEALVAAARKLRDQVGRMKFAPPVAYVYNPLEYAWEAHEQYLRRYGAGPKRVVFLGMNPGPFGMAQTGVPFGEIPAVRDWLGIEAPVSRPKRMHPKRPIEGFACKRSEVSGRRLWGFFREQYGTAEKFFEDHFVVNYCPLIFMEESGRNRTPDKLPAAEWARLRKACDDHLAEVFRVLQPEWGVGVGGFAEECLTRVLEGQPVKITRIPHPSPANPAANRDWGRPVKKILAEHALL